MDSGEAAAQAAEEAAATQAAEEEAAKEEARARAAEEEARAQAAEGETAAARVAQAETAVARAAEENATALATVAVVAKKKSGGGLHANKGFVFPRHFSTECCGDIKRSTSTAHAQLDGTPRPKMKCSTCKRTHARWTMLPEHRVPLNLPHLLEPISKLELTPSDEYSLRGRLQMFTQQK